MEEKKKKQNIFLKIILVLFLIFISLYLMDNLGYYNIASKDKILTEEKLKEFEKDVKEGNAIDLKKYTKNDTNYKNFYSNIGYKASKSIDTVLNKGLKNIGKILKKLFENEN